MPSIEERLTAIEARQFDHRMHDPTCPSRHAEKGNAHGMMYYVDTGCECWLEEWL